MDRTAKAERCGAVARIADGDVGERRQLRRPENFERVFDRVLGHHRPGTSPRLVAAAMHGSPCAKSALPAPRMARGPRKARSPPTVPRRLPAAQWPTSHTAKMPRCACAGTRIVPLSRQLTGAGDRFHSLFSPSFAFPVRPFAATTPALSVADAAPVMRCACVGP